MELCALQLELLGNKTLQLRLLRDDEELSLRLTQQQLNLNRAQ